VKNIKNSKWWRKYDENARHWISDIFKTNLIKFGRS